MQTFPDISSMLTRMKPREPVYCLHADTYRASARSFLRGFSGRVLYAVKANNEPAVISLLHEAGVSHFDCASLDEIELVKRLCPAASCYFMNPVRIRAAAAAAQQRFGVRHFMVDDAAGIAPLIGEIDVANAVIFVRMAISHESAAEDLSAKFGADPRAVPELLRAVADTGAEAALAFNVGSGVRSPDAYAYAIDVAGKVLDEAAVGIRLLDIGDGFPHSYPGYAVPPLPDYFAAIQKALPALPLIEDGELLAEPGRALSAAGLSAVVQVLLRKGDRLYINDGMYGALWELRCNGQNRYAATTYRNSKPVHGSTTAFHVFGPTCDSSDRLPEPLQLAADIDAGDYIRLESMGAYSLSGRSDFNGFGNYSLVAIESADD